MELLENILALLARLDLASKVYCFQTKAWDQRDHQIIKELQDEKKGRI